MTRRDALSTILLALAPVSAGAAASVSTLIGDGTPGHTDARVYNPYGLAIGPDGWLYFCDLANVLTAVDVTGDSVLSASPPRPVQDLAKFRIPTTTWDVFADGRIIGIQRSDTEDALPSINLVFNWTDEVKRRLGR